MDSDNSDDSSRTPKKKKVSNNSWRKQAFTLAWLQIPEFSDWLAPSDDDKYKAKCKVCNKILVAGRSDLKKHANTSTHKKNAKEKETNLNIKPLLRKPMEHDVITAELRYALLAVEHNLSFRALEGIITTTKSIFNDSKISSFIKMKRLKCTYLINNLLAKDIKIQCDEELKDNVFSILIDETTDLSNDKNLCVLIRYYKNGKCITQLLDIIKMLADGGTAENMYKTFIECLKTHNLNINNIVGYCSDNANVMMGKMNSFQSYLIKDNPNIFILGCTCHSVHLIASHAADELPKNVESLMHSLYSYFSRSPKRQAILEEIQNIMKKEKHRMINPSRTRWLALRKSVNRILEQWTVLQQTFILASIEDKNPTADLLLNELNNPYTKAYFQFMQYVLPYMHTFDTLFQSEKCLISNLHAESERFLRLLCSNFIKPNYLTQGQIENLNLNYPHIFLPIENMNIGNAAKITLSLLEDDVSNHSNILQFKLRCLRFYKTAAEEAIKRLPLKDKFITELEFLIPKIALSKNSNRLLLTYVCDKYKNLVSNIDDIITEWNKLPFYFSEDEVQNLKELQIELFWNQISEIKNFNNEYQFTNLFRLAKIVLSLPHANADVERIFSMCNDIKTKKRNRLGTKTLCALLRIKMQMKNLKVNATNYPLRAELFKKYNATYYYREEIEIPSTNQQQTETDILFDSDDSE